MVAHDCNLAPGRQMCRNCKFKASEGYVMRACLKEEGLGLQRNPSAFLATKNIKQKRNRFVYCRMKCDAILKTGPIPANTTFSSPGNQFVRPQNQAQVIHSLKMKD